MFSNRLRIRQENNGNVRFTRTFVDIINKNILLANTLSRATRVRTADDRGTVGIFKM